MKRILFLIAMLFVLQSQAQTGVQSTVKELNRAGAIYTQKVVVHNDTTYIMSQNNGQYEFYNTSTNQLVKMLSNFVVHDFQILDTNIYICGTTGSAGFLAYSSLADFFSGSAIYSAYIQQSQTINKIQVFYDHNAKVRIAGIGTTASGQSIFIACIEDNNWAYDIYQNPTTSIETFDDIILKNDYIVTVGRGSSAYVTDAIVRTYKKNSIQSQTQIQIQNAVCNWKYVEALLADTIGGDSIAIVGKATDADDDDFITSATLIDMAHVPIFTGITYWFGSTRYINAHGEYKFIKDIKYSSADKKLLILEEHPYMHSPTLFSSIIVLDIAQHAPADICYSAINGSDFKFNNLTETNSYTFLAAGINPANNQIGIWEGLRGSLNGNCSFTRGIDVGVCQVDAFITGQRVTGNYAGNLSWGRDIKLDTGSININVICN